MWARLSSFLSLGTSSVGPEKNARRQEVPPADEDDDDFVEKVVDVQPPSHVVRRKPVRVKRTAEDVLAMDAAVVQGLSSVVQNGILHSLFSAAQQRVLSDGRINFDAEERDSLLATARLAIGAPDLTYNALRKRVGRVRDKGTPEQVPSPGRPRTFTPEMLEAAKRVSRAFGGEISRNEVFEQVSAEFGAQMCGRSTFYRALRNGAFKRRRVRYKPTLSEEQMVLRVEHATSFIASNFADDARIVFVDEKRFEATSPGILNLRRSCPSTILSVKDAATQHYGAIGCHETTSWV